MIIRNADTAADIPAGYDKMVRNLRYYRDVISNYIYYYNELPDSGKLRFLKRVHYF
ncbi:MAG: hypothetical protein WDO19_23505 [Bacteroidota bacterium]